MDCVIRKIMTTRCKPKPLSCRLFLCCVAIVPLARRLAWGGLVARPTGAAAQRSVNSGEWM